MKLNIFKKSFISLSVLALFHQSLSHAETYQWTDTDGSVHFSDNPVNAPKGKKTIVRENGSSTNSSLPLRRPARPAPSAPLNHTQTTTSPSSKQQSLDPACTQEYKDATRYCEAAKPASRSENEKCIHKRVSSRCKLQFDNAYLEMTEETVKAKACMDTRQKIYQLCGYPQNENWKCHMKYMTELEDACKNISGAGRP
jgi:hypothetical protein